MKYYVVIPAHDEEKYIAQTLDSLTSQTVLPSSVVVVDDHSNDRTAKIALSYVEKFDYINMVHKESDSAHLPGSKVIKAFNLGLSGLDENYDVIVKLDADLILPTNYFEKILKAFKSDPKIGMAGGFAYIKKNGNWELESLADKDHIRGAFKAYRKECFNDIGGLRTAMGWDTADELLAQYHGWKIHTDETLVVKHLKPTGANYNQEARYKQGESFYTLGYGFAITLVASAKLAVKKKQPKLFLDYIKGYQMAKSSSTEMLVNDQEAAFIRKLRWKKMKQKLF